MEITQESINFFLFLITELSILFLATTFIVGILKEFIPEYKIRNLLSRWKGIGGNITGAFFGALTPFCSCSTIPILIGLLDAGVGFGITFSFLIASPLINPVVLGMMATLISLKVTVIYTIIVFLLAVVAGNLLEKFGFAKYLKRVKVINQKVDSIKFKVPAKIKFKNAFNFAFGEFKKIALYLFIAAVFGALIHEYIPSDFIAGIANKDNPIAVPLASVIGIPMYVRASSLLAIVAVLLEKGMSIGAVIALFIGSVGASIPEVTMLSGIFKRKLLFTFLTIVLSTATISGFAFNLI